MRESFEEEAVKPQNEGNTKIRGKRAEDDGGMLGEFCCWEASADLVTD
jgi:hypothetical protein